MSGRLVISRHKRWHVWNQDNIKRVRDDEAKHAAEVEEKAKKEKELLNEQSVAILKRQAGINDDNAPSSDSLEATTSDTADSSKEERFTLFEDPSHTSSRKRAISRKGNIEHEKEEEIRKKKAMISNGMQPWSFDDVTRGLKPWYNTGSASTSSFPTEALRVNLGGKEIIGEEAEMARQRDCLRKDLVDPMAGVLKSSHDQIMGEVYSDELKTKICSAFLRGDVCKYGDSCRYIHGVDNEVYPTMQRERERLMKSTSGTDSSSESSSSCKTESMMKHSKRKRKEEKHKKEKKHRKSKENKMKSEERKSKKSKSRSRTKERGGNLAECPICFERKELSSSLGDCEHYICNSCQDRCDDRRCPICRGKKKSELERNEMRLRRLERESAERKRSNVLVLSTADAGARYDSSRSFHQIYHPYLS